MTETPETPETLAARLREIGAEFERELMNARDCGGEEAAEYWRNNLITICQAVDAIDQLRGHRKTRFCGVCGCDCGCGCADALTAHAGDARQSADEIERLAATVARLTAEVANYDEALGDWQKKHDRLSELLAAKVAREAGDPGISHELHARVVDFHYEERMKAEARAAAAETREKDTERGRLKAGEAMFSLVGWLKVLGYPQERWPDELRDKFADAVIDDSPLTDADIQRTRELAARRAP